MKSAKNCRKPSCSCAPSMACSTEFWIPKSPHRRQSAIPATSSQEFSGFPEISLAESFWWLADCRQVVADCQGDVRELLARLGHVQLDATGEVFANGICMDDLLHGEQVELALSLVEVERSGHAISAFSAFGRPIGSGLQLGQPILWRASAIFRVEWRKIGRTCSHDKHWMLFVWASERRHAGTGEVGERAPPMKLGCGG